MADVLGSLSAGFVALIILSLVVIVAGFLLDSTGSQADGSEPPPPSHLTSAVWDFAFAGLWAFMLSSDYGSEPDWLMMGLIALFLLFGLFHLYKYATVELWVN